ncbi:MAG TPA: D,D-dipeptide ABC transporter permease, partial [Candidatus Marinimicrobia bacterium]|nr:D,D-dipeptide ABC transporter permease [Candidatus Neomarinimicrobiota bacterium]
MIPGVFLLLLLFSSILIPYVSPYAEDIRGAVHFKAGNQAPSLQHWFGTDAAGRDIFTLTIRAGLSSLKVALGVVILAVLLGTPLGLLAGTIGRWVDEIIMRITDGFLAFPPL